MVSFVGRGGVLAGAGGGGGGARRCVALSAWVARYVRVCVRGRGVVEGGGVVRCAIAGARACVCVAIGGAWWSVGGWVGGRVGPRASGRAGERRGACLEAVGWLGGWVCVWVVVGGWGWRDGRGRRHGCWRPRQVRAVESRPRRALRGRARKRASHPRARGHMRALGGRRLCGLAARSPDAAGSARDWPAGDGAATRAEKHAPQYARLAQSAERKALNLVVVGSSPTVGVLHSRRRAFKPRPQEPTHPPAHNQRRWRA